MSTSAAWYLLSWYFLNSQTSGQPWAYSIYFPAGHWLRLRALPGHPDRKIFNKISFGHGILLKVSKPIVNKDIINFHFRFLFWMSAFRKVNSKSWPSHLEWILYPERDTYPYRGKTWFEKNIRNGVPMSHDVNSSEGRLLSWRIIPIGRFLGAMYPDREKYPDWEISPDRVI